MTLPLTMHGRLADCLTFTYRTPATSVAGLLPKPLEPDTQGEWAFWNIVAASVEDMRPAGVPQALGVSYHHVSYQLLVKAKVARGDTLRGVYFVRSDADSRLISQFGNAMTDFRFAHGAVELSRADDRGHDLLTVSVQGSAEDGGCDALARALWARGAAATQSVPPLGSPFATAEEAAAFLADRTVGIAPDLDGRYVQLAEVVRDASAWREYPVRVIEAHWPVLESLGQHTLHLERATRADAIDCRWRLGRKVAVAPRTTPKPTRRRTTPARAAA